MEESEPYGREADGRPFVGPLAPVPPDAVIFPCGRYFSPLAFPLLAGPGALAVVLGLNNRHDNSLDHPGFVVGIVLVAGISYLVLAHAERVLGAIGPKGIDVLNRITGLIVLAIAVELVFNGISDHFGIEIVED